MSPSPLLTAAVLAWAALSPARAAEPPPEPFLNLELNAAPFRGANPEDTRARVKAFVAKLGRPLQTYQDNDALLAVTVKAKIEESPGAFGGIERSLRRLRFSRALRGLGLGEVDARGDDWQILLQPYQYEDAVRSRLAPLPEPAELSFYQNRAMTGMIWLHLSVSGLADAEGYARQLARRHPGEVRSAAIMIEVPVARFTTGGG